MNFGSKLLQTALTTISLHTEVNKSLLGFGGEIIQQKFKPILTQKYFERKNEIRKKSSQVKWYIE